MTRHCDGNWIGSAGASYSPHGAWLADLACHVGVAAGLAAGNLLERLPYLALEGCGANVERQVDGRVFAANGRQQRLDVFAQRFIVAMNLAGLDHVTALAAWISGGVLVLGAGLYRMRLLPIGGERPHWRRLLLRHRPALTKRFRQLVRLNAYGGEELGKWYEELARFRTSTGLELDENSVDSFDNFATRQVKGWVAADDAVELPETVDDITPEDYEHLCADLLRKAGWEAEVTGQSGDQGVDVMAQKNDLTVAIQCKLYFGNPVGNKAVQEAHAAAGYIDAGHAIVVSNRDFTTSAEQLAAKLGVLLLHHSELGDLEGMLRG